MNTITSTTTTTQTPTTTVTVTATMCPAPPASRIVGTDGVQVPDSGPGTLLFPDVKGSEACCFACWGPDRVEGCSAWASGPNYCFLIAIVGGPGPSDICPAGLGGGTLYYTPGRTDAIGGPGSCAGDSFRTST